MGLFNHLFGNMPSVAREVRLDSQKRLQLWQEHLANYSERERLSSSFSFRNVDAALQDFDGLIRVLGSIERLIDRDIIDIEGEEKTESEILADLTRLVGNSNDYTQLHDSVLEKVNMQKVLLAIFQRIHDVLKAELHAIKLIRQKPGNVRELLLLLFQLVFQREAILYRRFNPETFRDKLLADKVGRVANAILLGQELKKEVRSNEEKFISAMVKIMGNVESKHRYRRIGEEIFIELAELAGAPLSRDEEITEGLARMENLTKDEELTASVIKRIEQLMMNESGLFSIVRKLLPWSKYGDEKVLWVMKAFRKSYDLGHFIDLEGHLAT